ncbi:MAG: hypothetical protein IPH48_07330 [bacterium]|nr:hypothetical protein [bacterium]
MRNGMPVNRRRLHVLVLMLGLLICAVPGRASPEGEWLTVGIGRGNDGHRESFELLDEAAFLLGGSVLRDSHIWSLRHARVGFERSSGDVAFLYERVLSRQRVLVTVGAGVGLMYRDFRAITYDADGGASLGDRETGFFDEAAFAWSAQVMTGSRAAVGWGLQGFGSAISERSFWGVAVAVQFGERGAVESGN